MAEEKGSRGKDGDASKEDRTVVASTETATKPLTVKPGEKVRIVIPRPPVFSG